MSAALVLDLAEVSKADVGVVGGKNASLGEMIGALFPGGVAVPAGFATTAAAFRLFLDHNGLVAVIADLFAAHAAGEADLAQTGKAIRAAIIGSEWPVELREEICRAYAQVAVDTGVERPSVAVRSSATAEDLPEASFAGQQETFLNVSGEGALLDACLRCYASLYTDRAISYRAAQGFAEGTVALSVGVQRMVRADEACSGVMFTIDTDTGFPDVVMIDGAWGLGENVVQGVADPDAWQVFKPLLANPELCPIIVIPRWRNEAAFASHTHGYGAGYEPCRMSEDIGRLFTPDTTALIHTTAKASLRQGQRQATRVTSSLLDFIPRSGLMRNIHVNIPHDQLVHAARIGGRELSGSNPSVIQRLVQLRTETQAAWIFWLLASCPSPIRRKLLASYLSWRALDQAASRQGII